MTPTILTPSQNTPPLVEKPLCPDLPTQAGDFTQTECVNNDHVRYCTVHNDTVICIDAITSKPFRTTPPVYNDYILKGYIIPKNTRKSHPIKTVIPPGLPAKNIRTALPTLLEQLSNPETLQRIIKNATQ